MAWQAGERRKCSACGVECIGAKSKGGSVGPIELAPHPNGNVLLFTGAKGEIRYAVLPVVKVGKENPEGEAVRAFIRDNHMVLRMNHFATCPRSEEFRRGRALDRREADDIANKEESNV